MKFYNEKRVKRMWRKRIPAQNAAWKLLYASRRAADKV